MAESLYNHNTESNLDILDPACIDQIQTPEALNLIIDKLLTENKRLQQQLMEVKTQSDVAEDLIDTDLNRLEQIHHGITDLNERMTRPYIMSQEMKTTLFSLETLANQGGINSLILEGEPGTGKTQLVYSLVGEELSNGSDVSLVHIRVKDTMSAQDLLYSVDNIRRLSDSQTAPLPPEISREATQWKQKILRGAINPKTDPQYRDFADRLQTINELSAASNDLSYDKYIDMGPLGEAIIQSSMGKKVYLLIDEIEKGREELMTGILDEIENLTFNIPEINETISGNKSNLRIFITTNTEESHKIPSAFRRRCLYSFINYPDRQQLSEIVEANYPNINQELLGYALDAFNALHHDNNLRKKPSTPELLSWIAILNQNFDGQVPDGIPHQEILLKYEEDFERAQEQLQSIHIANDIWKRDLITDPDFIRRHIYNNSYIYDYDDTVQTIVSELSIPPYMVINAILFMRNSLYRFPYDKIIDKDDDEYNEYEYDDDDEERDDNQYEDNDESYDDEYSDDQQSNEDESDSSKDEPYYSQKPKRSQI